MNLNKKIKKIISWLSENQEIIEISVYDLMVVANTTQYAVAKAIAQALVRKGVLEEKGRGKYHAKGR